MTTHVISIEINEGRLSSCTDSRLAMLWHVAQANPQDGFATKAPGELAERIGREIIRRWLREVPPELWKHQGRHYHWHQLTKFAKYVPGGKTGSPEWHHGQWVPRDHDQADETAGGREQGRPTGTEKAPAKVAEVTG